MPSFFQKASNAISSVAGIFQRYGGQGYSKLRWFLPGSRFDYEAEAGDLWSNPVVALGLAWLGDRFPRPIMQVSRIIRSGEYRPLGRHDLTDLWNRPNKHYGRRTLEKAVGLSLKVDGNAYILKVRNRLGNRVVELWWIPHFRILPMWPADGTEFITEYRIRTDTGDYVVPASEVIHIRDGIDPRNERLGISALKANLREVCTVNQEAGYTASILRNSGVPGLMVIPDDPTGNLRPNEDDASTIKGRIKDSFSGDGAGETVVLAGKYKVEVVGFSPEQLILDRLPQSAVARVASAVGVASMSIHLPDPNKTYSNLAEANRASWGTVVSTHELVDEALRWQLLPDFGEDPYRTVVERDYSHIQELQESLDAIHTRTREDWKAGLIKLKDAQEQLGYEADEEDGDRYFPGTGGDEMAEPELPGPDSRALGLSEEEETKPEDETPKLPGDEKMISDLVLGPFGLTETQILANVIFGLGLFEHFKSGTMTFHQRQHVIESIRLADQVRLANGKPAFSWSDEQIHAMLKRGTKAGIQSGDEEIKPKAEAA